jgi:hypothetical protein
MAEATRDPDDLYGDSTVFLLEIRVRRNGAMSVAGDIYDLPYALAVLDNAKDSIRSHHARLHQNDILIVPPNDVDLKI